MSKPKPNTYVIVGARNDEAKAWYIYVIVCAWDDEAKVWYIQESEVPGLSIEAPTGEVMNNRIVQAVPELLRLNAGLDDQEIENSPVEVLWVSQSEELSLQVG